MRTHTLPHSHTHTRSLHPPNSFYPLFGQLSSIAPIIAGQVVARVAEKVRSIGPFICAYAHACMHVDLVVVAWAAEKVRGGGFRPHSLGRVVHAHVRLIGCEAPICP